MNIGYEIKLDTIKKVEKFTSIIETFKNEIDIISGRYVINAKSVIAIFSLDLTSVLKVIIHDATIEEIGRLQKVLEEFRVD